MSVIEISVLTPDAALQAFAETWATAESGDEIRPRLAFGSLRDLVSAITEKRLELLRHVAGDEGVNVQQLAQALNRDYDTVHADVAELVELGLLQRDTNETLFAPYDEILIHADIRDAA